MTDRDASDEPADTSGSALAQGDLAVNLFIVLLVILAVLTLAEVSSENEGYLTPFRPSESALTVGPPVLGWQPVLPAYPKVVLRDDTIHLVDLRALAEAFAANTKLNLGNEAIDTSKMLNGDLDPMAHRVFLTIDGEATFPSALSARAMSLSEIHEQKGEDFFASLGPLSKLDLFLFPQDVARAASLIAKLHDRRIAVRVVMMPRQNAFGFVQSGGDFGLERTFK